MQPTIVFDLDGTLIDSRKDLATGINLMRQDFDLPKLPLETIVSFIGNGAKLLVERSIQDCNVDLDEAILKTKMYYKANMLNETTMYSGVKEALRSMQTLGFKMAVLTNKPQEPSIAILKHLDLDSFFEYIIGCGDEYPLKPDPTALIAILDKTDGDVNSSWMIGDHNTDLEVANRANVKFCYANYGFGHKGDGECVLEVESLLEFVEYLKNNKK